MITTGPARVRVMATDLLARVFDTPSIGVPGWASESLLTSIRSVVLLSAAGWQAIMIAVTALTGSAPGWPLMAGMSVLALAALAALRGPLPDALIPVGMASTGIWCYLVAPGVEAPLTLAACWQINFATFFAGLLVRDRRIILVVIGYAAAAMVVVLAVRPDWSRQFAVSILVTQTAIIIALRLGLPALLRIGTTADEAARAAEEATRRAVLTRESSARIAEEARVLHDTAINTLGAIANAGAGITDLARVRQQCARDVVSLTALRAEQPMVETTSLLDLFGQPGLPTRRGGLTDEDLEQIGARLSSATVSALVGCVREAVTNATKHSGADYVSITTAVDDGEFVLTVADDGVGFDPVAAHGRQRGLANSIAARASDAGIATRIHSGTGLGTRITLLAPLDAAPRDEPLSLSADVAGFLGASRLRAAEMYGLGVTLIGVLLTAIGGANAYGALFLMLAVMAGAWLAFRARRLRAHRGGLAVALVAAALTVFVLSAAATDFGSSGVVHWQALAPTGALIMTFALLPSLRIIVASLSAVAAVVIALALTVAAADLTAAGNIAVAGCVTLGFAALWARFQILVERIGARSLRSRQETFTANLATEVAAAAQAHYLRWMAAGLDDAITLLQELADGSRHPADEETRALCADEERYLRQLVQISPELIHLGREMMPTLQFARDRGIDYSLRLGSTDTADEATARLLSAMVLHNLATTPSGSSVLASVFPAQDGLQLTLVGSGLSVPPSPSPWPTDTTVSTGLIEMVTRESDRVLADARTGGW
ncbi:sensor histidine kinase [Microbacterium nymphoidis]|uniref:sensor histidine kinase n=1 Tax=Microbacterium nymphoidis TaxID=2898586 RepID=UPI001E49D25C|nr:ATP-binding protein [Microbacterium nymphoidis]MCD2499237.1 ATP-binding protein [Microbacterium nymphoidis]